MVRRESKKDNVSKAEKIIFDPPLKPRYFPGEVDQLLINVDFECYKKHRIHIATGIKPKIDNKPPPFHVETYYDQNKLNHDARRARMSYKQNLELGEKINTIFRVGGKVDCWNFKDKKYCTKQRELKYQNRQIRNFNLTVYRKLKANSLKPSQFAPSVMAKEWKRLKALIEYKSRFPWFKEVRKYPSVTEFATAPPDNKSVRRTKCFFDLELTHSKTPLGRIIFQLYNDYVPLTCANFEAFCRGHNGLSYKGTPFHRILSNYWCQGGDVTKFNGTGGASIYEEPLPGENFTLRHTCPGVLTTCSDDKNSADSKFNLTFQPLKTMDGRRLVFGKVIKGTQSLFKIEGFGTKFGNPLRRVIVSNCGVLKDSNSSSSTPSTAKRRNSKRSNNSKDKTSVQKASTAE